MIFKFEHKTLPGSLELAYLGDSLYDLYVREHLVARGGRVRVELSRGSGRRALVRVADTGIGIPKADQDHIFDRFYRVDKARSRETGGTGLGLSIVQQIVKLHGGTVNLVSEEGKGSTFTVDLPLSGTREEGRP